MRSTRGLYRLAAMLLAATAAPYALAVTQPQRAAVFDAVALGSAAPRAADPANTSGQKQESTRPDTAPAAPAAHPTVPAPASPVSEQPPYVQLLAGLGVVLWLGLRSTASQ